MDNQDTHTEQKVAEYIISRLLQGTSVAWTPDQNHLVDTERLSMILHRYFSFVYAVHDFSTRDDAMKVEYFRITDALKAQPIGPEILVIIHRHLAEARRNIFSSELEFSKKIFCLINVVALLCLWFLKNNQEPYVTEAARMISFVLCFYFPGPVEDTLSQICDYAMEYSDRHIAE